MYDFIIIGAGSAGCVLANRLSEDPAAMVTLIEAGGSDKNLLYQMPAGYLGLMKAGMGNWKYESVPQPGLGGRSMYFPRGKVLGGSSSINGLVFVRGSPSDFDGWARQGCEGWSYDECLPYFRKLERCPEGSDVFRGKYGPIGVKFAPPVEDMNPISQAWFRAAQQAGYPYNHDFNGASQEGFSRANANIAQARRQSTAHAYLEPIKSRANLTVITKALAVRIVVRRGRAVGVEIIRKGRREIIETSGEVLLAAGAINSPQLLQLSGIGQPYLLAKYDIKAIHELPGVGENLQDHASVSVKQEITKPYSALSQTSLLNSILTVAQYVLFKKGAALENGQELQAFLKTRPELEAANIQFHFPHLMYDDHGRRIIQREGFIAMANASRPQSRGSVKIGSADPRQAPLIDPNYFAAEDDLRTTRAAIRIARELIAQPAFDDFRGPEYAPGKDVQSDAELDDFIRETAMSVYHPVGTCKMGTDSMSVVDSSLCVHGLSGLRVIDASIMPAIVSGNTNAATMMIAERGAEFILSGKAKHNQTELQS